MTRLSRRNLLAGTGTAVLAGVAGCLGGDSDSDDTDPDSGPGDPQSEGERWQSALDVSESLAAALGYVYRHGDHMALGTGRLFGGDESGPGGPYGDSLSSASVDSHLQYRLDPTFDTLPVGVWVGEFELDPDLAVTNQGRFRLHELDAPDEQDVSEIPDGGVVVATDGEVLLTGGRDRVTATIDSHRADEVPYLSANSAFRAVLDELVGADGVVVADNTGALLRGDELDESVDPASLPTPLGYAIEEGQDTVQWQFAAGTTDESVAEDLKRVGGSLTELDWEAFDHRVTDDVLVVEAARAVTSPDEGPGGAPLGVPEFETYNAETGEILLRFDRGESVSVGNVTLEFEGEPYEGNWARGAETVGAGSQIAVDADAVEPGDSLRVVLESEDGATASASEEGFLELLPFAFSYDAEARSVTLTYLDGPPLPGGRTDLRTGEDPLAAGEQVRALPDGLRPGDTISLESVDPGTGLIVVYERTDGETIPITAHRARPPGNFSLENNGGQLLVTRPSYRGGEGGAVGEGSDGADGAGEGATQPPEQEPLPAEHYEVRVDGDPTETQWTDEGETIDPGDTLAVGPIQAGSVASVVWVDETAAFELDSRRMPPGLGVALSYDETAQQLTLVHNGGESVDADALSVVVESEEQRVRSWDGDTVSPGDKLGVGDVGPEAVVRLQFQGDDIFEPIFVGELAETHEVILGGE
jgi:hypothetical protein